MLLKIDRKDALPLFRQLVRRIKDLIDQGSLKPGEKLPSSRSLAEKLGVDRTTVYQAYAELQALGYLRSRPGSYNIVQKRKQEVAHRPDRPSLLSWARASSAAAAEIYETFLSYAPEGPPGERGQKPLYDLATLSLDPRLYPVEDLRRSVQRVLLEAGSEPLGYGSPQGYLPLREHIARRLRLHGISVAADEILVTSGAQQALDLVARLLGKPGLRVVVEAPTYSSALPLFRFNGLRVVGVPMRRNGLDLEALEKALALGRVAFVYTMPNFQNPTGITTSHQHRERLLNICLRHMVPVVEDGFEEDLKYRGPVALPVKSIDEMNLVIYLGTFSKALFPGLRVGWVTADKGLIQRLVAIKRFSDLTTNNLGQAVMHRFCELGFYDRHLKKLYRVLRRRMQVALKSAREFFPAGVSWTEPAGGYLIWVRMPKKVGQERLRRELASLDVAVSPGEYFFPEGGPSEYFRICIARLDEAGIREGMKRLGQALHKLAGRG